MTKTKVMNWLQKNTMTLILVLVFAFFAWRTEGKILMPNNISNLIAQNAYVFILATGMLLCILTGGNIDLAVGSVVCFSGAVGALMMANGTNLWVAVAVMLAIGLAVGALQAFCIAYIKVPPFITTLAGQLIFRGLSNVVLGGKTCSVNNAQFLKIFGGGAECSIPALFGGETINSLCVAVGVLACLLYIGLTLRTRFVRMKKGYQVEGWLPVIGRMVVICAVALFFFTKLAQYRGIPSALIWVVLVVSVYAYITSKTKMGRYLYAVGGNQQSAALMGLNVKKTKLLSHILCSFYATLGGLCFCLNTMCGTATQATGLEMDAISSAVIGGTLLTGGVGNVIGTLFGVLINGTISSLVKFNGKLVASWANIITAILLCFFILLQAIFAKIKERKK